MRKQRIIALVDCSGSMDGTPIVEVNKAMQTLHKKINRNSLSRKTTDLSVLAFSNATQYIKHYNKQKFYADGNTFLDSAYDKLYKILKDEKFDNPPIILLLTDGSPSDTYLCELSLKRLQKLKNFKRSIRLAVGYNINSSDAKKVLLDFTSNNQSIVMTNSLKIVSKVIAVVTKKIAQEQQRRNNRKVVIQILAKDLKILKNKKRI